jgi:hypothetical protein
VLRGESDKPLLVFAGLPDGCPGMESRRRIQQYPIFRQVAGVNGYRIGTVIQAIRECWGAVEVCTFAVVIASQRPVFDWHADNIRLLISLGVDIKQ